ncbi:MAG: hypothetical protein LRY66_11915 [Saccharospirillaceae bacterium]|nr:hypothetical protein [Saccharospirillaceae bacterium]MCD8532025.1 hypothetical protein [Saccharospirillaceae bacterium]
MRHYFLLLPLLCFLSLAHSADGDVTAEAVAVTPFVSQSRGDQPESTEQRLLRGAFYYHYLTNNYQQALVSLDRLQNADLQDETAAEAMVMKAAVLLALGLESDADALFAETETRGGEASANAWYHLARRWHARSEWEKAERCIRRALQLNQRPEHSAVHLNDAYSEEAKFILVASLAEQDRANEAADVLASMAQSGIWTGYARYNQILSLMRLHAVSRDLEKLIEEAIYYLPDNYEGQSLKDRILLVAGIYALDAGKYSQAESYLRQISLDSAFTAPGLLQYGWSLVEQWKYEEAMQPWRILQQRFSEFHPAVIESILAVPHALELLNATTQSLRTYEFVEKKLVAMLDALRTQNTPAEISLWLDEWQKQQQGQSWGWQRVRLGDMPDGPMSRTLQDLLDDSDVNQMTAGLHDLSSMLNDVQRQQQDLLLWQAVLQQRQKKLSGLDAEKKLQRLEQQQADLTRSVLALQQRLYEEDKKVFSFASARDQANVDHLAAVVPRVEFLQRVNTPTRDLGVYKERWRRSRGLQLWRIYEEKPERQWQAQKNHWQLQGVTSELLEQLENTRTALLWADSSWVGFPQRVAQQQAALKQQEQRLQQLHEQQRQQLITRVSLHMAELDVRITEYLAQARLSVARLYDDSLQQQIAGGEAEGKHE